MSVVPGKQKTNTVVGSIFRDLRTSRKLGLRQVAKLASDRGLKRVTMNVLGSLERGETKSVSPEVLREIAAFYKVDYDLLVIDYAQARFATRRDLPDHELEPSSGAAAQSQPQQGGSIGPASATPPRVQPVDPAIVSALENVALLVAQAIQQAKGQPVREQDARTGKGQSGIRRRAGGDR